MHKRDCSLLVTESALSLSAVTSEGCGGGILFCCELITMNASAWKDSLGEETMQAPFHSLIGKANQFNFYWTIQKTHSEKKKDIEKRQSWQISACYPHCLSQWVDFFNFTSEIQSCFKDNWDLHVECKWGTDTYDHVL